MKKLLSLMLAIILCMGCLCACSSDEVVKPDENGNYDTTTYEPSGEYISGTVVITDESGEQILSEEVSIGVFSATNAFIKACNLAELPYKCGGGEISMVNDIETTDEKAWHFIVDGLSTINGNFPIEDGFTVEVTYMARAGE